MYCPDCGTYIDRHMQKWAYDRFHRWACADCGWIGEKMKMPPFVPRDIGTEMRGYIKKVA